MRKTKLLIAVFLGLVCSKISASETIQLAFEQTPLAEAVSFFSETSGLDVSIPEGFNPSITIHQTADDYRQAIEKIAAGSNLNEWSARVQLNRLLDGRGILKLLEANGARRGDTIHIGPVELEWS